MTIEQAANTAGISASHLSRVERAQVGVRLPVVKVLLSTYGADPDMAGYLVEVAKEATQRGWWQLVRSLSDPYSTYIGFEAEAAQIWSFDASIMPGLLQTEAYARAMFQGGVPRFAEEEITQHIAVRMRRQEVLTKDEPAQLWVVLDEAVIRRQVGGPALLATQLEHVIEVAALPHVDVQVLPFTVGAHPGTPGSFVVLRFPEPTDTPVVYVETMAGELYPEGPGNTDGTTLVFDRLRAMALSPDDSVSLIRQTVKELR
jgi:hypothetical protein